MAYIGKTPSQAVRSRYFYTASGGETSFSGADDNGNSLVYTDGNYVDVYLNGVLLVAGSDYNTNTTNTVAGIAAVVASDIVEIVVYDTFSVFGGDVLGDFTISNGTFTASGLVYPTADGTANQVLTTDGSGNLSFGAVDIVSDLTPQLGGTLDANGNSIDMGTYTITDAKVGQWDTAYGWGDHSTQNYAVTTGDTMTGDLTFGDGVKAVFGSTSDGIQIYNEASGDKRIVETGSGNLKLQADNIYLQNTAGTANHLIGITGAAVTLNYNNNAKLATTNTGVDVTGSVTADGLTVESASVSTAYLRNNTTSSYATTDGGLDNILTLASTGTSSTQSVGISFSLTKTGETNATAAIGAIRTAIGESSLVFKTRDSATGRNERMRITSSGRLGLGLTNPEQRLHIDGFLLLNHNNEIRFKDSGGTQRTAMSLSSNDLNIGTSAGGNLKFYNGSSYTERLRINSSGDLLVGTTDTALYNNSTTGTGFHVAPSGWIETAATGTNAIFNKLSSDGTIAEFRKDGSTAGSIGGGSGYLTIGSGTGNLAFYSGLVLPTASSSGGTSNGVIDLGNSSNSFKDLYLSGTANVGTVQINSSASGSNALEGSVSAYNTGQAQVNSRIDFLTDTYANSGQIKLRTNFGASTKDGLIVDEHARVTMPFQPYAFATTSVNNYSPSAGDIVQFDVTNTNRGGHYDTTNYRFTCPVAGDYLIVLWFSRYNFKGDLVLRKNGSNKHYLELRTLGAANEWQVESFSFVLSCAANDYLDWKVNYVLASGVLLDGQGSAAPYDGVMYRLLG